MGWQHLISWWENAFSRADVIVFPDFSLPMLYSVLDTGNFFVIPGSPVDVWTAKSYSITHYKIQLRTDNGFNKDDMLVLVVGSSFFYNELSWDYAVAMHDIGPLLIKYARGKDSGGHLNFSSCVETSPMGTLMLYRYYILRFLNPCSALFKEFIIRKGNIEVVDGVHGMIYPKHKPDALMRAFSLLISKGKLYKFADVVASSGRRLAKNMQASDCMEAMQNCWRMFSLSHQMPCCQINERVEKDSGFWDEIYRNARKAEKLKFEANERDEGELKRTGQALCVYQIYNGARAWHFLHHGSLYRGLSLSTRAQRLRSDDADAVGQFPHLNDSYYRDILCEIGGMFAVANRVDDIHK